MIRRAPNDSFNLDKEFFPYNLGNNQVSKMFLKYLLPVFSTNYKDGTALATYYKDVNEGKSEIYVDQPKLEKRLWEGVITPAEDSTKYLVGATGVGKTTLIRNVFQVFDRKCVITKNNLIIYHSFFNMEKSTANRDKNVVIEDGIINTIETTCNFLGGYKTKLDRLKAYKETNFFEDFYNFIDDNNPNLASSVEDNYEFIDSLTDDNMYAKAVDSIKKKNELDYEMTLLKYYVKQYNEGSTKPLNCIVFILDDIESQNPDYQDHLLELVWRIKKCMGHQKSSSGYIIPHIKMLVALRNFSFRIQQNIHVQKDEAHREIPVNDIILKDQVPHISRIIKKRTDYILSHPELVNKIQNITHWNESVNALDSILVKMYGQYDDMLLNLTHDNLFYSMILVMRIITNRKFIGKYEIFKDIQKSAFDLTPEVYRLSNPSKDSTIPGNDEVFYSLVYGEKDIYFSVGDYYLTNILNNKGTDNKENYLSEIWGPYIIKYLIQHELIANRDIRDSFETPETIIDNILSVFTWPDDVERDRNQTVIKNTLRYYYTTGVLRESITKPRNDLTILKSPERKYSDEIRIFLSTRGNQLYEMLKANSLLLEAYRDDIESTLPNNDVPSLKMHPADRLSYCIQYINAIRLRELELLYSIKEGNKYVAHFGTETLTVHLLWGIKETINTYYTVDTEEKQNLMRSYNEIVARENDNISGINEQFGIALDLATSI